MGRPRIQINNGDIFHFLTVVKLAKKGDKGQIKWVCKCRCGNQSIVASSTLARGDSRSCGCYNIQRIKETATIHGMHGTVEYHSWQSMLRRCLNKNNPAYKNYGGRGIVVCKRWLEFKNFYKDMGRRPNGMSLDRIDNNKGYSKENCRWASRSEQNNNNRRNRLITYDGITLNIAQWARKSKISRQTLYDRLFKLKWDFRQAITSNFKERRKSTF